MPPLLYHPKENNLLFHKTCAHTMLKKLFTAFALLLIALTSATRMSAQCTTNAGQLVPGNIQRCIQQDTVQIFDMQTQPTLDANDVWHLVIHTGTATTLGTILAIGQGAEINIFGLPPGGPYTVSSVAGNRVPGTTLVDLNDPCLSVTGGATLTLLSGPTVTVEASGILGCNTPTVLVTASTTEPGNYAYEWVGTGLTGDLTQPTVTATQLGTIGVTVTDLATGCTGFNFVIVQSEQLGTFIQVSEQQMDCELGGASMLQCSTNIATPNIIQYLWSTGATTQSISVLTATPATYTVTATNSATGCSIVGVRDVLPNQPLSVTIIKEVPVACSDSSGGLYLNIQPFVWGAVNPVTIAWSNGSTALFQPYPSAAGTYTVTVTHTAWGCSAVASVVVENDPFECGLLSGTVWGDMNSDCAVSSSDIGLHQIIVRATPTNGGSPIYGYTDSNGAFSMRLEPDNYSLEVTPPNALWATCQNPIIVSVPANSTVSRDIFLKPDELCTSLTVDLSIQTLIRCFTGYYHLNYANNGTITANGAYIDVTLDDDLTLVTTGGGAGATAINLGNNQWRFPVGDLSPNEDGYIYFQVQVGCDGVAFGQTHCTTAEIFPNTPCSTPANWSGASLQITGADCDGDTLTFTIKNIGNSTSGTLEYVVIEDAVMLMSAPPPIITLGPNETHPIAVPANGATWRLEVTQEPNHPGFSAPSLAVEGCGTDSVFSTGFVNQFPQDDTDSWIDTDCTENVGSYDPNDKQGFPIGYGNNRFIEQNTDIEYMIRFQNTGTAPAFTVVIRDTLSAFLDPTTFVAGSSSHPYKVDFYGDGPNLRFTFDNINLPDSATNLEASQGYVTFRISQRKDLALGSLIENSAAIYFDFNEPIITNTTRHLIGKDFVAVSAWEPLQPSLSLAVTPNPMGDKATLQVRGLATGVECRMELLDLNGRTVKTHQTTDGTWTLHREQMTSGTYVLRVVTEQGLAGVSKIVIK
jgi:uncharacterized repeat protein (TIGR01451 family)